MKLPIPHRLKGVASITKRGPSAQRGRQFSGRHLPELIEHLARVRNTLRQLDSLRTHSLQDDGSLDVFRSMNEADLARLRRENVRLQSDLRAELRRRGAYY
jgi:hypothetical protein